MPHMIFQAVWRLARRVTRGFTVEFPSALSALASLRREPNQLTLQWPVPIPKLRSEVALFAHYDANGEVGSGTCDYLQALREAGFSVLFVSNSETLRPDALAQLRSICDAILVRRNYGLDFSAWRAGIMLWHLPRPETRLLLLVNDSLIGPLAPLRPVIDQIDLGMADVWGASESLQRRWHLQSFFLAVGPKAMASPVWKRFWDDVRPVSSKEWVIRRYELGFAGRMRAGGLRCRAIWPYEAILRRFTADAALTHVTDAEMRQRRRVEHFLTRGRKLNPSADLWRQMLRLGFPFIKRELLAGNPAAVADVDDCIVAVSEVSITANARVGSAGR